MTSERVPATAAPGGDRFDYDRLQVDLNWRF
jgi:hypothetical protein